MYRTCIPAYMYNAKDSVRSENVGNWIVSAKIIGGCQGIICIYNKDTLREHYRTETSGLNCMDDASEDIKKFYKTMFDRDFARIVAMARAWN